MQAILMPCGCTLNTAAHEFATASCPIHGGPPRIPDAPCPKCGAADVRLRYEDGDGHCNVKQCGATAYVAGRGYCREEHFHRTCERCLFRWTTWQVLPLDS